MFKKAVYVVFYKNSAAGMRDAVKKDGSISIKVARGEEV